MTLTINSRNEAGLVTDAIVTVLAHNEREALMNALDSMDRSQNDFSIETYTVAGPAEHSMGGHCDYYQIHVS